MENDAATPEGTPDVPAAGPGGPGPEPASAARTEALKQQYDELHDRYLRLAADFDNFRKRSDRETERIIRYASETLATDILEVADNIDRAARADDASLREGLIQIQSLLAGILARHGVTPIESLGKAFDPAVHEAIAHLPSDREAGMVIDEMCRGYRMHDKVIRYAKVAVSKGQERP